MGMISFRILWVPTEEKHSTWSSCYCLALCQCRHWPWYIQALVQKNLLRVSQWSGARQRVEFCAVLLYLCWLFVDSV